MTKPSAGVSSRDLSVLIYRPFARVPSAIKITLNICWKRMRAFSHFGVAEVAVELIQPRQPEVGAVSSLFGRLDSRADNRKTISAQTRGLNSAPTKSGFL